MAKNVVIIGGGFAGAFLARRLERRLDRDYEIFILSRNNYVTYFPMLPEVVGASVLPGHVVAPLRQMVKRTRIRMVEVEAVDVKERRVHYLGEQKDSLSYDQLVLACGLSANLETVPGMATHAYPLKTVGDALYLRNQVLSRLEQATIHPDPEHRKWLTTFIVIGGGFSGVEVAAEIDDFLHSAVKYYKNVTPDDCRVILLQGADRLLPELSESLAAYTLKLMQKRGVQIWLNTRVAEIREGAVRVKSGEIISGSTVISTIGTSPTALVRKLGLPLQKGRVITHPDMSVPDSPGMWAVGDCAAVPNAWDDSISPTTAQFAERQAGLLAENLVRTVAHRPARAFRYKPRGQLASIGHRQAVAEVFGIKLSGFIAWLLWRGVYLLKIPTVSRKARIYLEWNWAMFFPPDIAHLDYTRSRRDTGD